MKTSRITDFSVQEAQALADLSGVCADLEASRVYCERLLKMFKQAKTFEVIPLIEALSFAAIVQYARPSVRGVRQGIPSELIKSLDKRHQKLHKYFMNLRHKWIAHSVNAFEENFVQLRLNPPYRGRRVAGVEVSQRRTVFLGVEGTEELIELITVLLEKVNALVEVERDKVLQLARTLSVDDLYENIRQPPYSPPDPLGERARSKWEPLTRRCSRRAGLSRSVQSTARAIPSRG